MREVGACELERARVRAPPLEGDHGDDQSGEPQPDHRRQQSEDPEEAEDDDRRHEGNRPERGGFRQSPSGNPLAREESVRKRVRKARGDRSDG